MGNLGGLRHGGFYLAAALGLAAGLGTLWPARELALVIGVNLFFVTYLGYTAVTTRRLTAAFLRLHADEEDAPAPLILIVMLGAVTASAASLFLVLMGGNDKIPAQLVLGVTSVVLGWLAIHTMWAMHYAYEYYQAPKASAQTGGETRAVVGGLDFPGGDEPDGMAFLYFSYVIGMTAQTSDTAITSNAMRRYVTMQGVFAFFFNTVLVAAAVNIVVSLAH